MNEQNSTKSLALLTFVSLTMMYTLNLWYSISGIYLYLLTSILFVFLIFLKNKIYFFKSDYQTLLSLTLFFFLTLYFTVNYIDINGQLSWAMVLNRFTIFFATFLSIFYFSTIQKSKILNFFQKYKFPLFIICAIVIHLTVLRVVRIPDIDLYSILKNGPVDLLQFKNPYETYTYSLSLKAQDFRYTHYAYGPASLFLFLPFDIIFKEPRYLLFIANFVTAYCLYKISKGISKNQHASELLALIFLFIPRNVHFFTLSFTDILITSLFAIAMLAVYKKKVFVTAVGISLLLGVKIFYGFPLIFLLKNKWFRQFKLIGLTILLVAIYHLPFFILNPYAMYKSMVDINTGQKTTLFLQQNTITFGTFVSRQFSAFPPDYFFYSMLIFWIILFWLIFKKSQDISNTLIKVSFAFTTMLFWGPIAMANYYFFASSILLFSIAFVQKSQKN